MGSERERRQTLGRRLRLCVNQFGQRLRGNDINTLTVIATESYEQFAENLQRKLSKIRAFALVSLSHTSLPRYRR